MSEQQLPTIPGKVDGVVGWDPLRLQCRDCGAIYTGASSHRAYDIIRSGFHFHTCEGRGSIRRCPACLDAVKSACSNMRCKG